MAADSPISKFSGIWVRLCVSLCIILLEYLRAFPCDEMFNSRESSSEVLVQRRGRPGQGTGGDSGTGLLQLPSHAQQKQRPDSKIPEGVAGESIIHPCTCEFRIGLFQSYM